MKMMLSGFNVVFEPELTEEKRTEAIALGIPIDDTERFRVGSPARYLRNWVDYPFPFLLADSLVIDDLTLEGSMWTHSDATSAATDEIRLILEPAEWSRRKKEIESERLRALCLNRLIEGRGNDQVFETYSAQRLIDEKKEKFQEELFNITLDERFSRFAQGRTSEMVEKNILTFDEMVVPTWLYETFRTSIAIFAQKELLPDDPFPVYDKEQYRDFYENALLAEGRASYSSRYDEGSWTDFLETLPKVAEKLPVVPLSKKYTTPEDLAGKILELRSDSEIKESRKILYKVFLELKHATPLEEVKEKLLERLKKTRSEKKKTTFRMALKGILGSMVFAGHVASIQIAIELPNPLDLRMTLLALPYFVYKLGESLESDLERLDNYCWTGFFEKLA